MTLTVNYAGVELSNPDMGDIDHSPICNVTQLKSGGISLQGHARNRRQWTITCMADSHTEIDTLLTMFGQRLDLTIDGVEYGGVMICPPFVERQITPVLWTYTIGFIQEIL